MPEHLHGYGGTRTLSPDRLSGRPSSYGGTRTLSPDRLSGRPSSYGGTRTLSPDRLFAAPPANDISTLIDSLSEQTPSARFTLLGSSFGGAIALELAQHPRVNAVLALSPVLSFKTVHGFETLEAYLAECHAGSYRFLSKNWAKLTRDELLCPKECFQNPGSIPITIYYGTNDPQISPQEIEAFCAARNVTGIPINAGHLSTRFFSELLGEVETATRS